VIEDKETGLPVFIGCPRCQCSFSEAELRSMLGKFARANRFSSVGASRFARMTPEQRSAEGRRAATARWANRNRESRNPSAVVSPVGRNS
jgi:hypothetical protein